MGWLDENRQKRRQHQQDLSEQRDIARNNGRGEPGSMDPDDFVLVSRSASHLGGFDGGRAGDSFALWMNCQGVGADNMRGKRFVAWGQIAGIDVTDRLEAKSRLGATVMFGVAALGAKDRQTVAELHVRHQDGRIAAFAIEGMSAAAARARISPTLASVGVPLDGTGQRSTDTTPTDLVSQLERLATLHAAGAITDDEYADFKQQLRSTE